MRITKLAATDAFVVFDLDDAARSVGVTRLAPKILIDGAALLARSNTYLFASFGQQVGGASGGINAKPDQRDDAIAAFVAEMKPLVERGELTTEPGRGLGPDDLVALAEVSPTPLPAGPLAGQLLAAGVLAAAEQAAGGLDGRRVALEGLDGSSAELVAGLGARGATIVAASTAVGTVLAPGGLDAGALADGLRASGAEAVDALATGTTERLPTAAVFGAECDVLLVGSKAGVIDHEVEPSVTATVVVPSGPVPVTAKAIAQFRRRGTIVVPDFVSIAGPCLVAVGAAATPDDVAALVAGVLDEVLGHEAGAVLGACFRAEAFLSSWQPSLPFGRPLA